MSAVQISLVVSHILISVANKKEVNILNYYTRRIFNHSKKMIIKKFYFSQTMTSFFLEFDTVYMNIYDDYTDVAEPPDECSSL